ncbi:MAG: GNAT family N-acetyltransferase [Planctomycetota bacterium]
MKVHTDWDSLAAVRDEWDALGIRVGGDVYTSPDYAKIWWDHYGRGELAIVEVRGRPEATGDARLLGVVPCFIERLAWAAGARVARLITADSTIVVLSPAVEPVHAVEIWAKVLAALAERCDIICLAALDGRRRVADSVLEASREAIPEVATRRRGSEVHTTFVLPATFEDFMQGLEKRQRTNLKRDMSLFARQSEPEVATISDRDGVAESFDRFLSMHAQQWSGEGKAGHFGDWRRATEFSIDLNRRLSERGRVQMVRMAASGHVIAYEWSFAYGQRGFWRLPARSVDPAFEKLGLGRLGMARMIEAMIAAGVREIEAGPGHYDYKVKHGAVETPLESIWVFQGTAANRFRAAMLAAAADAVHLIYYRVWFRRIRARLGRGKRPIAGFWVRLRL